MIIDDISVHYSASKSSEFRKRVKERFEVFAQFMDERNFSVVSLVNELEGNPDSFRLKSEQLSEEGMEWVRKNYDKWLRKIDRQKSLPNKSELSALLESM